MKSSTYICRGIGSTTVSGMPSCERLLRDETVGALGERRHHDDDAAGVLVAQAEQAVAHARPHDRDFVGDEVAVAGDRDDERHRVAARARPAVRTGREGRLNRWVYSAAVAMRGDDTHPPRMARNPIVSELTSAGQPAQFRADCLTASRNCFSNMYLITSARDSNSPFRFAMSVP